VVFVRLVQGAGEVAWFVGGVRVGEEKPCAASLLRAEPAGVGFASKAAAVGEVQRWCCEY